MKKIWLALLSLITVAANAQTADDVIQKYSANLGGLEAFNKIKTVKITGNFTTQGMDFPMTVQVINGKASRTDVEIMDKTVIRVYNDGKAWTQNPYAGINEPKEVTGPEVADYKAQSMLASALMDYKARGHQVELQGEADVEGVKTFKIKLTSKDDGKATIYYINTKDYMLLKTDSERDFQGQNTTIEVWYSNLKDFNGTKFFMNKIQKMNGETFQETTFTNIELNVVIDESIFKM